MFQGGAEVKQLRNENTQLRRQLVHLSEELIDSGEQINRLKRKVRALAGAGDASPKSPAGVSPAKMAKGDAAPGTGESQKLIKALERRVEELEAESARAHQIATKQSEDLI